MEEVDATFGVGRVVKCEGQWRIKARVWTEHDSSLVFHTKSKLRAYVL